MRRARSSSIGAGGLVPLVEADHDRLRDLVAGWGAAAPDGPAFWALCDLLVRHEVAEEAVVYPCLAARAGQAAAAGLADQAGIEERLAALEATGPDSPPFAGAAAALARAVVAHLAWEESAVLAPLGPVLGPRRSRSLGAEYRRVRDTPPRLTGDGQFGAKELGRAEALAAWLRDSAGRRRHRIGA